MARRCLFLLLFGVLSLTSCQRAQRYKAEKAAPPKKGSESRRAGPRRSIGFGWHAPRERHDLPILFVPDTSKEWPLLKSYWNDLPFGSGMPTAHVGLAPMQALAAMVLAEHHAAIKIKVPRGLPDPTDYIPKSNPLTYGKWRLGKALFHEARLAGRPGFQGVRLLSSARPGLYREWPKNRRRQPIQHAQPDQRRVQPPAILGWPCRDARGNAGARPRRRTRRRCRN